MFTSILPLSSFALQKNACNMQYCNLRKPRFGIANSFLGNINPRFSIPKTWVYDDIL